MKSHFESYKERRRDGCRKSIDLIFGITLTVWPVHPAVGPGAGHGLPTEGTKKVAVPHSAELECTESG